MVIVGHNDIECCYLMPGGNELATGVLADDYYQQLIKSHAHKMDRRRDKFLQYLEWSANTFHQTCTKLIRSGMCERVLKDFDFCSTLDRDDMSPRARRAFSNLKQGRESNLRIDEFGDPVYRLYSSSSSDEDSDQSFDEGFTSHGATRPKSHDYEMLICGFFYFFILQDPFVRQYLELRSI